MLTGRFIGDYSRGDEFIYKDVGRLLNDSKVATIEIFDTCYEVSDIYTNVGDGYWRQILNYIYRFDPFCHQHHCRLQSDVGEFSNVRMFEFSFVR